MRRGCYAWRKTSKGWICVSFSLHQMACNRLDPMIGQKSFSTIPGYLLGEEVYNTVEKIARRMMQQMDSSRSLHLRYARVSSWLPSQPQHLLHRQQLRSWQPQSL